MYTNVFSISENVIVSDKNFLRLNSELRKRGFLVEETSYSEIGKMSGLFRCSTMPLIRK
jgi:N-dimethylarginine dimethylaminohydrolase